MSKPNQEPVSASTQKYFDTNHLKANLKQRSVRGGAVIIVAQGAKFFLKIASTAMLARLLVPEDFGLMGMATVLVGFVEFFKDLGLSTATIQRPEINHRQVSILFWINIAVSLLVATAVICLAPAVVAFYSEPRLRGVTIALGINFIFGGLTVQHQALLKRQMRFRSLATIDIVAMAIGVVSAIVTAYLGWNYWALVMMLVTRNVANAAGVWLACGWRPGWPKRNSGVRSLLAFGGNVTGFSILNYFSRNLDNILIGRRWGSLELGIYAQAYKLVLLPIQQINSPVTSVALPTLSSLQSEPQKYAQYYYKAMLAIATLGMPTIGFLFADADRIIPLVLGEQWLAIIPIFKLLMPAAFEATLGVGLGWAYQSWGHVNRLFRWGIASSSINAVIFFLGVRWGALGVAAAYGLTRPIFTIAGFIYCFAGTPLKVGRLVAYLRFPALASFGGIVLLFYTNQLTYFGDGLMRAAIDFVTYALAYLLIWILLPNGRSILGQMLRLFKMFRKPGA